MKKMKRRMSLAVQDIAAKNCEDSEQIIPKTICDLEKSFSKPKNSVKSGESFDSDSSPLKIPVETKTPKKRLSIKSNREKSRSKAKKSLKPEDSSDSDSIPLKACVETKTPKRQFSVKESVQEKSSPALKDDAKPPLKITIRKESIEDKQNFACSSTEIPANAIKTEDEIKNEQFQDLLKNLSQPLMKNREELLLAFKNIVGNNVFTGLKSLFNEPSKKKKVIETPESSTDSTETPESTESEESESSDFMEEEIVTEKISKTPSRKLRKRKEIKRSKRTLAFDGSDGSDKKTASKTSPKSRKKRTEIEKLNEDVMEMFIKDGVLAANGLRNKKKVVYSEALEKHDTSDISNSSSNDENSNEKTNEDDDESVVGHKGSSVDDATDRDEAPLLEEIQKKLPELKPCRVVAEKLNLDSYNMPIKVSSDGSITEHENRNSESPQLVIIEETVSDNPEKDVKPNPSDIVSVKYGSFNNAEIITIDSDEDEVGHCSSNQTKAKTISPVSKSLKTVEKVVCNLSYYESRDGIVLKCNSEKCKTQTNDELMFKYHIQTRHIFEKWSGSCQTCEKSVGGFGNLLDEFEHMYNNHIKKPEQVEEKKEVPKRGRPKKTSKHNKAPSKSLTLKGTSQSDSPINAKDIVAVVTKVLDSSKTLLRANLSNFHQVPVANVVAQPRTAFDTPSKSTNLNDSSIVEANQNDSTVLIENESPDQQIQLSTRGVAEETKHVETTFSKDKFKSLMKSTPTSIPTALKLRTLPGDKLSTKKQEETAQQPETYLQLYPDLIRKTDLNRTVSSPTTALNPSTVLNPTKASEQNVHLVKQYPDTSLQPFEFITTSTNAQTLSVANGHQSNNNPSSLLRPWLESIDNKHPKDVTTMLKVDCLLSTFKCMGSLCFMYTSDTQQFLNHLNSHDQLFPEDAARYRRCAYCNFSGLNSDNLAVHILSVHKNDRYGCNKCFYKSISITHIINHSECYHNEKNGVFLDSQIKITINIKAAVREVRDTRHKFIAPICCPCKL